VSNNVSKKGLNNINRIPKIERKLDLILKRLKIRV